MSNPSPYEHLPIGVIELDRVGGIERWNVKAAELLDWPAWRAEVPAPPAFGDRVPSGVLDVRDDRPAKVEVRIERQGGPAVWVAVSHASVVDERGERTGTIVSIEDRSEGRLHEQTLRQAERLGAMERLAGGVAHEFNNLLTVVLGYSQMLLRTVPEDDERREPIEAIAKAGRRATELTSKLALVGRRRVVQPIVLDALDRVTNLEPVLRGIVGNGVELRIVTGDEPARLRIDPQELELVVTNLVINASEALPEGGRVVVDCRPLPLLADAAARVGVHPGSYVVVTVADTGAGMTDDVREHCFDPFFTTKSRWQGAGVGLAAVYGVAAQAGGGVEIASQPDRGCTVRVYLPAVAEPVVLAGADNQTPPATPKRRSRKLRILLVDDEEPIRNMLTALLEGRGHQVVDAASAEEALERWEQAEKRFHLVISDLVMPGLHGDELARLLLEQAGWLRVLLISGYVERAATLDPDRVSFLAKPFSMKELVDCVETMVPARRQVA